MARTGTRYELCLSLSHPTWDCSLAGEQDSDLSSCLKTLESAMLAITSHGPQHLGVQPRERTPKVCRNWKVGRCRISLCCYKHACRVCGGPNPAYACCDRALALRSDSNMRPLGQRPLGLPNAGPGPSLPAVNRYSGPGSSDRSNRIRQNAQPY